jgi:hypothetical protein
MDGLNALHLSLDSLIKKIEHAEKKLLALLGLATALNDVAETTTNDEPANDVVPPGDTAAATPGPSGEVDRASDCAVNNIPAPDAPLLTPQEPGATGTLEEAPLPDSNAAPVATVPSAG